MTRPGDHILCGIDFSAGTDRVFKRSLLVAKGAGLPLHVVHVGQDWSGEPRHSWLNYRERAELHGVECSCALVEGDPVTALGALGSEPGCRLLLIGPGSSRSLGARFIGHTPEAVIRRCAAPVLAVRSDPHMGRGAYRKALACLNFEIASSRALRASVDLNLVCGDTLALVHALPPVMVRVATPVVAEQIERTVLQYGNEATLKARHFLAELGLRGAQVPLFIEEGDVYGIIAKSAAKSGAEMLIMGLPCRSTITDFVLGSTVRTALRQSPYDIFVRRDC